MNTTIKNHSRVVWMLPLAGLALGQLLPTPATAALTPAERSLFDNRQSDRVDAMTILSGDYGIGGGTFNQSGKGNSSSDISVSKFGGSGVVGSPQQLGNLDIGWQPQLQGSMGYLTSKKSYSSVINYGDNNENKTFAIQFGGGARFWFNDSFSIAPTFMGMYGHSENDYTANSLFGLTHQFEASRLGLINWSVDTWTIRPSLDFQYQYVWHRTIFTASSEPTYFYTESFSGSSGTSDFSGNSETWKNKIDVDVPLGVELFGHELRTGGSFSRTEMFGDIKDGLNSDYLYDAHGRLVLDFLNELWKVQYIGLGVSYLWGEGFEGWSFGADVAFRF